MKLLPAASLRASSGGLGGVRAFTLGQILVASGIFSLVVLGAVSAHMFGMRMLQITQVKLSANDNGRRAMNLLAMDIRAAKMVEVGQGSLTTFVEASSAAPQQGNAIQVYSTTSTNSFIRYFWDSADSQLKRMTNGAATASVVLGGMTNSIVFTCEDFAGNVLTKPQNSFCVGVKFVFAQMDYPAVSIGEGQHYQSYKLETKIARRSTE
jgi:hypothetical protein